MSKPGETGRHALGDFPTARRCTGRAGDRRELGTGYGVARRCNNLGVVACTERLSDRQGNLEESLAIRGNWGIGPAFLIAGGHGPWSLQARVHERTNASGVDMQHCERRAVTSAYSHGTAGYDVSMFPRPVSRREMTLPSTALAARAWLELDRSIDLALANCRGRVTKWPHSTWRALPFGPSSCSPTIDAAEGTAQRLLRPRAFDLWLRWSIVPDICVTQGRMLDRDGRR